jgi:iron complex outermembrane receptor protein
MKPRFRRAGRCLRMAMLGLVCATGANAEENTNPALSEQDFFGEVPMVLSVSRLVQPVSEAPAAVTVIDRDMIRTSGFRDLADLFRFVPGFYVGLFSGNEHLVSGGLNNRFFGRVQVLLDGKSVYTPTFGQVPWTALPLALEDIERIEVSRGPNAATYGANSFLGVINIITRHPVQDQGTLVAARSGAPALADGLLRHGGKWGDLDYRVTLSHKQDHGFELRNDSLRTDSISGRGDYRIDNRNSLQFQFGYTGSLFGSGYFGSETDGPRNQRAASSFQQIVWRQAAGADDEMSLQFYHTYNANHEAFTTIPFSYRGLPILPSVIRTDLDAERFDLEFQRNQRLNPALRLAWGLSSRLDRIRAPIYLGNDRTQDSQLQRLFLNAEWRPATDWILNAGAAWEHNDITGSDLSPRLALSYHPAPGHTVRVGMSRALRTPTVLEDLGSYSVTVNTPIGKISVPRYFGDTQLHPESIVSHELAYLFEAPAQGFSADVRLYEDHIHDVIAPVKVIAPFEYFVFRNASDVSTRGVQTQVRWRTGATQLNLSHAYTKTVVDTAYNAAVAEDLQHSNPSHTASALLSHRFAGAFEASVGYYYVRALEVLGDGDPLKTYRRWDARLAYDFRLAGQRGQVAVALQNLFKTYNEYRNDNAFEPRAITSLSLEF